MLTHQSYRVRCQAPAIKVMALLVVFLTTSVDVTMAEADYFTSGYSGSVLLDEVDGLSVKRSTVESETYFSGEAREVNWSLRMQHIASDWQIRLGNPGFELPGSKGKRGLLSGETKLFDQTYGAKLDVDALKNMLGVSLSIRSVGDRSQDWSASYRLSPTPQFTLHGSIASKTWLPESSVLFYDYLDRANTPTRIGGNVQWRAPSRTKQLGFEFAPTDFLSVEFSDSRTLFDPGMPQQGDSPEGTYVVTLDGGFSRQNYGFQFSFSNLWQVALNRIDATLNSRIRGFDGGRRFLYFGLADASLGSNSVTVSKGELQLSFNSGEIIGGLEGAIDAWPFLNGILGSIGEQNLRAEGKARWKSLRIKKTLFRKRRLFELPASLLFIHAETDANYVASQAGFGGFGRANIRGGELSFKGADLALLRFEPTYRFKTLVFQGRVSQWLPLSIRGGTPASNSDSVESPTPESGRGAGWAGLSFGLAIKATF
jgi:hypothetical protein